MKLIIYSEIWGKNKVVEIDEPKFIPRVGEKIVIWYNPPPIVKEVIYNFEKSEIIVVVD